LETIVPSSIIGLTSFGNN